jgi:hypothetical protein
METTAITSQVFGIGAVAALVAVVVRVGPCPHRCPCARARTGADACTGTLIEVKPLEVSCRTKQGYMAPRGAGPGAKSPGTAGGNPQDLGTFRSLARLLR